MKAGVIDLLAEILRGTPKLDGALCIGRHTLFTDHDGLDPDAREHAIERAVALCTECEASWKCAEFAANPARSAIRRRSGEGYRPRHRPVVGVRAKRALPAPPLSAQDVRYRPPRGRRHGPILTREELSWARHAVAETILRRVRTGEPVPQSLHQLLARLTDLLEIGLPAGFVDGTESGLDVGQLDEWIDTAETAGLMGCTPEYVRRIAEELGGQRRGRQWFIPRRNIIEHLNGREAS